jgi:murein DD-endopeptidase MepM/ murein hydrolase activator NlpD
VRALAVTVALLPAAAGAQTFTYQPPGTLVTGSGQGRVDDTIYAPGMRFPIEEAPAYANSQVWGRGGSQGGGGSQCDAQNYAYPWWDNYCESRSWDMPMCPTGKGHQGQDIRAATCVNRAHWAVAAEDGTITSIGSYSVYLTTPDGTRYDYLHMGEVAVSVGDRVTRGQRLGKVSNEFGGAATTVHLHLNIRKNVSGVGLVFVPPYMSLVRSYEALLGVEHPDVPDAGVPAPDAQPPPDAAPLALSEDLAGGCAVSGGGASPAPVLVLLAALRRRRRGR